MISKEESEDRKVREQGRSDGSAVASWVIDGNTSVETAHRIVKGIEDCDPAIFDGFPVLQLGEWADDPAFADILHDLDIELDGDDACEREDDLFALYSDGWSEGLIERIECDARAMLETDTPSLPDDPATASE